MQELVSFYQSISIREKYLGVLLIQGVMGYRCTNIGKSLHIKT